MGGSIVHKWLGLRKKNNLLTKAELEFLNNL
jgi:hypothetical protein